MRGSLGDGVSRKFACAGGAGGYNKSSASNEDDLEAPLPPFAPYSSSRRLSSAHVVHVSVGCTESTTDLISLRTACLKNGRVLEENTKTVDTDPYPLQRHRPRKSFGADRIKIRHFPDCCGKQNTSASSFKNRF